MNGPSESATERDVEPGDYILQVWDDRFYREELAPAIRSFNAKLPERAIQLLRSARTSVSRSRDSSGVAWREIEPDVQSERRPSGGTASRTYCMSPYATTVEWLDDRIENARTVPDSERRRAGGLMAKDIMDVLGVVSRDGLRMSLNIDDPEAAALAGRDDDLFGLLQGTSDCEVIEETPGPNFTACTVPRRTVMRVVEAIRNINGVGEGSTCLTRSMEVLLIEASQPYRRLVVIANR